MKTFLIASLFILCSFTNNVCGTYYVNVQLSEHHYSLYTGVTYYQETKGGLLLEFRVGESVFISKDDFIAYFPTMQEDGEDQ